jgi:hypothetical protein
MMVISPTRQFWNYAFWWRLRKSTEYPEGVRYQSPGLPRSGYPGSRGTSANYPTLKGFHQMIQPFQGRYWGGQATQGSRCAATWAMR